MNRTRHTLLLLAALAVAVLPTPPASRAQAFSTSTRALVLQAGGDVSFARSGSAPTTMEGYGIYVDLDTPSRLGVEVGLHQLGAAGSIVYERSYEMGLRYHWRWRGLEPYGKGMYGRGVFNFPPYAPPADPQQPRANLGYNLLAAGGGADLPLTAHLRLRADLTWQQWLPGDYPTAPLPGSPGCPFFCNGMRPAIFTIGAALRLPAGRPRVR